MTLRARSRFAFDARAFSRAIDRWFPLPALLDPPAAGIDISDASIKWLTLAHARESARVEAYGSHPLPRGVVTQGAIRDTAALAEVLRAVKPHLGRAAAAHAALPEEAAYVFSMRVPRGSEYEQVLRMIEFEFEGRVPIPPEAAVYDFNEIPGERGEEAEIAVVVFPRELAEGYARAFREAGISLLSLEVEARSIARAVSSSESGEPITLLVDFGRARTGFAVLKRGIPIFTSTVEVGGATHSHAGKNAPAPTPTGASKRRAVSEGAVTEAEAALADEVARHYHYWDTRRNDRGERVTPVGRVVLVGGSSNLEGLTDYIAGRVQAPTERGDVWRHVCSFDEYIPPIERHVSLQYATAIGLALRGL